MSATGMQGAVCGRRKGNGITGSEVRDQSDREHGEAVEN